MDEGDNLLTSFSDYYINTTATVSSVHTIKTSVLLTNSSPTSNASVHLAPKLVAFSYQPNLLTTVETYDNITMITEVNSTHETTYNLTLTYIVTKVKTTDRIITASLNDTSREAYPYTIANNKIFNRESVLVASQAYPRNGSMSVTLSSGVAIFPGAWLLFYHALSLASRFYFIINYYSNFFFARVCQLKKELSYRYFLLAALHLSKPAVGTYQLKFTSSDVDIQPATILINVNTVRLFFLIPFLASVNRFVRFFFFFSHHSISTFSCRAVLNSLDFLLLVQWLLTHSVIKCVRTLAAARVIGILPLRKSL